MYSKRSLISGLGITTIAETSQINMEQGWLTESTRIELGGGRGTDSAGRKKCAGVEIQGSHLGGYGYHRIKDGVGLRIESSVVRSTHTVDVYFKYRLDMPEYDRIDNSTSLHHFVQGIVSTRVRNGANLDREMNKSTMALPCGCMSYIGITNCQISSDRNATCSFTTLRNGANL